MAHYRDAINEGLHFDIALRYSLINKRHRKCIMSAETKLLKYCAE